MMLTEGVRKAARLVRPDSSWPLHAAFLPPGGGQQDPFSIPSLVCQIRQVREFFVANPKAGRQRKIRVCCFFAPSWGREVLVSVVGLRKGVMS